MHTTLRSIGIAAAAAVLALAPSAAASPAGTVGMDQPYAWSGGPGLGMGAALDVSGTGSEGYQCTAAYACDDTLVRSAEAGDLLFELEQHPGNTPELPELGGADIDLYVYASDADGTVGEELGRSTTWSLPESVWLEDAPAGHYLVRAAYYHSVDATYDAKATLSAVEAQ